MIGDIFLQFLCYKFYNIKYFCKSHVIDHVSYNINL